MIQTLLKKLAKQQDLTAEEMTKVMNLIMTGEATPAQIGGFLMGLHSKGETITELTAAANVLRELVKKVVVTAPHLLDIVGTGGDAAHTFNISTASAFVAAAAGAKVAKHCNRSVTSRCGSADLLEAAGAKLDLTPEQIAYCIEHVGIGFMLAPNHHPAMRHVQSTRREIGFPTLFNLIGPLTNPALVTHQLIGVYDQRLLHPVAQVLNNLGSKHALVVHAEDQLDEISISANTHVVELQHNEISEYVISPEQFALAKQPRTQLVVNNAAESLALIQQVLSNKTGAARDIVALNAGAGIYAADITPTIEQGVKLALDVISSGAAQEKFTTFIELTRSLG